MIGLNLQSVQKDCEDKENKEEIPDDTHKCSSFQGYPKVNQKGILSTRKSARRCCTKPVSHIYEYKVSNRGMKPKGQCNKHINIIC